MYGELPLAVTPLILVKLYYDLNKTEAVRRARLTGTKINIDLTTDLSLLSTLICRTYRIKFFDKLNTIKDYQLEVIKYFHSVIDDWTHGLRFKLIPS